jgi:predicted O-methyltransferase YrrM
MARIARELSASPDVLADIRHRAIRRFKPWLFRVLNKEAFERDFQRQLPSGLADVARLVFDEQLTGDEKALSTRVEGFRAEIARGNANVLGHISPHTGDVTFDAEGKLRPGALAEQSRAELAGVGVRALGGVFLRRLVSGTGAKRVLELGTNTGLSGCYILAGGAFLHTIEGSAELCVIAERNLQRIATAYALENAWFDEALERLIAADARFDIVFVDGQHERVATEHYFERALRVTNPGGWILFDDIYWSDAMRQAWLKISADARVDLSIDLRDRGLVRVGAASSSTVRLDICDYIGRPEIVRHGY